MCTLGKPNEIFSRLAEHKQAIRYQRLERSSICEHVMQLENFETLLDVIKFTSHIWDLREDLKMLAFLLGQQVGYTKY